MKFGAFLLDGFRLSGYMPYLWITLGVLSVVVEAITRRRLAIWFLPAGIIAMASSFFTTPVWLQTLIFFACSLIPLLIVLMHRRIRHTASVNADSEDNHMPH